MSVRLKKIKVFGEGVYAKSAVVTRQRRVNVYLEVRKDAERSSLVAYGTPGLVLAFNVSTPYSYPARNILGNPTALYEVAGNQFMSLGNTGAILASGTLSTGGGTVQMALNPTQVLIVDGAGLYIYTPATLGFQTVAMPGTVAPRTCVYCNGFFVIEQPGSNVFWVSNLNDGTTWNGLSFGTAVQYIDSLLAVDTYGGMLILFGTAHIEFWQNAGQSPQPFQIIANSAQLYGLAAVYGRAEIADSLVFVALTKEGGIQICQIKGYSVNVISTTDIDNILQGMSTVADCTVLTYQQDEHKMAQFNFPSANRSLLWDATTGFWSESMSGIPQGYTQRHLANFSTTAYGKTYLSDFSNGNIYTLSPLAYTDNGNVIQREIVTRCATDDFNAFQVGLAYFDMESGVGLSNPALQGYNPLVTLERAVDNRDFGPPRIVSLGKQGQYTTRVQTRRNGRSDGAGMTFRLRMTDPVKFVCTGAAIHMVTGVQGAGGQSK